MRSGGRGGGNKLSVWAAVWGGMQCRVDVAPQRAGPPLDSLSPFLPGHDRGPVRSCDYIGPVLLSLVILQAFVFCVVGNLAVVVPVCYILSFDMDWQVFCMYHSVDASYSYQWLSSL